MLGRGILFIVDVSVVCYAVKTEQCKMHDSTQLRSSRWNIYICITSHAYYTSEHDGDAHRMPHVHLTSSIINACKHQVENG